MTLWYQKPGREAVPCTTQANIAQARTAKISTILIRFADPSGDPGQIEMAVPIEHVIRSDQQPISANTFEAIWAEAFTGYSYGVEETENAKAWFKAGYNARK